MLAQEIICCRKVEKDIPNLVNVKCALLKVRVLAKVLVIFFFLHGKNDAIYDVVSVYYNRCKRPSGER